MKNLSKLALAASIAATSIALPLTARAEDRLEVGRLECQVEGGVGMIIGSSKKAVCDFYDEDSDKPIETYFGQINKVGIDIGVTDKTVIQWLVFAPRSDAYSKGALAGEYIGVSAEATVGVGVGGNVLVGGSSKSFTLQPVSIQGQTGVNLAMGVTGFQLTAAE